MNAIIRKRLIIAAAAILIAMTIIIIYSAYDPMGTWWMPKCTFHSLTGLKCPGCGMQRALFAAFHGDITGALSLNLFLILSLPYLLFVLWGMLDFLPASSSINRIVCHRYAMYAYIVLFFVWWISRNLIGL